MTSSVSTSADRVKRQRHFWAWVKIAVPEYTQGDIKKNMIIKRELLKEHKKLFPQLKPIQTSKREEKITNTPKDLVFMFYMQIFQLEEHILSGKKPEDFVFQPPLNEYDCKKFSNGNEDVIKRFKKRYWAGFRAFKSKNKTLMHNEYKNYFCQKKVKQLQRSEKLRKRMKRNKSAMFMKSSAMMTFNDAIENLTVQEKVKQKLNEAHLETVRVSKKKIRIQQKKEEVALKCQEKERTKEEKEQKMKELKEGRQLIKKAKEQERKELKERKQMIKEKKSQERARIKEEKEQKRKEKLIQKEEEEQKRKESSDQMKVILWNIKNQGYINNKLPEIEKLRLTRVEKSGSSGVEWEDFDVIGANRDEISIHEHFCGKLGDKKCPVCKALLWESESSNLCCNEGQAIVDPHAKSKLPDEIETLFKGETIESVYFLKNIQGFNNVFSFTSFATPSKISNSQEKLICYKVKGNVYHKLGYLKPRYMLPGKTIESYQKKDGKDVYISGNPQNKFLDLYFHYSSTDQKNIRTDNILNFLKLRKQCSKASSKQQTKKRRERERKQYDLIIGIVNLLQFHMLQNNKVLKPLLAEFKNVSELIELRLAENDALPEVKITLKSAKNIETEQHKGTYHLPTATSEVAAIVNFNVCERPSLQVVLSSPKPDSKYSSVIIDSKNAFYDPMQYPMLLPNGDEGHNVYMKKEEGLKRKKMIETRLTQTMYYRSFVMEREGVFNYTNRGRRLFQQFLVDMYVKIETNNLSFFLANQQKIRKERYDVLCKENPQNSGQRIILPPTFTGGPRYMKQKQQDALSFIGKYGSPDFFITFTMNPKWEEFNNPVKFCGKGYSSCDRPDLISRVFKMKTDELMNDLIKKKILGKTKAYLYSIEWQKRGLPHVHILLWMESKVNGDIVDALISAEMPDPEKTPKLYKIVTTNMIHGPCMGYNEDSPCIIKGKCSKGFPKTCRNETYYGNNGYPQYRRRPIGEGGLSFKKKIPKIGKHVVIDNRWVVPYNPYLCLKYNAHINVECCNSIKCIAYVTKYVNKGCDKVLYDKEVADGSVNEVANYKEARYVNANEAAWKIFGFKIHKSYPPVVNLDLHLENEQDIFYSDNVSEKQLQDRCNKNTQLTAFFLLCQNSEHAKTLIYTQIPTHYVFKNKIWVERSTTAISLGRMRTVNTKNVELFYMRMLLSHKKGPMSFSDLRTFDGVTYDTYREAVTAMGLLKDESSWEATIMDIINHTNNRSQLRVTYGSMLVFCDIEDQSRIWELHKDYFASDFLHKYGLEEYNDEVYLDALDEIQEVVFACGGGDISLYGLPKSRGLDKSNNILRREKTYNKQKLTETVSHNIKLLNNDQKHVFDRVIQLIEKREKNKASTRNQNGFFIDASGGTGKSFVLNLLLDYVRSKGMIALAVASSGIAATVLHGGRTAHSTFKIPIMETHENSSCSIKRNTNLADLMKLCSLIVWDEVVMANKNMLLAVDITLRDILCEDQFMGGIPFVCAGDFRQILPVVRGGGIEQELEATIKNAYFWGKLQKLHLKENIRLKSDSEENHNKKFAEELLNIGSGHTGWIDIPEGFGKLHTEESTFIDSVYDNINDHIGEHRYFTNRAIISPLNEDVKTINDTIQDLLPGKSTTYFSCDKLEDEEDYQISTLNEMSPPSLPLHELELKVGSVVMVIRNLIPPKLCNGTRIILDVLKKNVIVGRILGGTYDGEQVIIPRIKLFSSNSPVTFSRYQFPVKLSFAMTINKSQGQTIQICGLYLKGTRCFSHGQLYVACSRVTNWNSLNILKECKLKKGEMKFYNVVYPEVFNEPETIEENLEESLRKGINEIEVYKEDPDELLDEIPYNPLKAPITESEARAMLDCDCEGAPLGNEDMCLDEIEDLLDEKIGEVKNKLGEVNNKVAEVINNKVDEKIGEVKDEFGKIEDSLNEMKTMMAKFMNSPSGKEEYIEKESNKMDSDDNKVNSNKRLLDTEADDALNVKKVKK